VDHVPAPAPADPPIRAADVRHPVALARGDLRALLHRRLRFAAALLACLYAVYLLKLALFYGHSWGWVWPPWTGTLVHVTLASEALAAWFLWSHKGVSLGRLRCLEWIIVGLPVVNQLVLEWQRLFLDHRLLAYLPTETAGVVSGRTHVLPWFALIVGYGVLIPNTWLRFLGIVATVAAVALGLNLAAAVADGVALDPAVQHHLLEVALWLGVAIAFATYNAYRIDKLIKVDKYRLLRELGRGGMGVVYLAEHDLLRRRCAVKLIHPERATDPQFLERFEREVQTVARLTHPNTIQIFDYGQAEDGRFYYAMEYLRGLDLDQLVKHHPLPPAQIVYLLRQVCGALAEAHDAGLIHRDIKPKNIMVCVRGGLHDVVKLLDFGLVREVTGTACADGLPREGARAGTTAPMSPEQDDRLTREGAIVGTAAYMSPEQAAGAELDGRSDLYSLGATAYFLLTGQPPFGRNSRQALAAHRWEVPTAPDRLRPDVPADLQTVVLRCLEKDPEQRYESAEALAKALAACDCATEWDQARAAAWWESKQSQGTEDA
jgi:serine/threonine-protein kinase